MINGVEMAPPDAEIKIEEKFEDKVKKETL